MPLASGPVVIALICEQISRERACDLCYIYSGAEELITKATLLGIITSCTQMTSFYYRL